MPERHSDRHYRRRQCGHDHRELAPSGAPRNRQRERDGQRYGEEGELAGPTKRVRKPIRMLPEAVAADDAHDHRSDSADRSDQGQDERADHARRRLPLKAGEDQQEDRSMCQAGNDEH